VMIGEYFHIIPKTAAISPAINPPSTNIDLPAVFASSTVVAGPTVGVGSVFTGLVVLTNDVTVIELPPPGSTQVHVGDTVHGNGPSVDVQVVVCPVHVTDAGHDVIVMIVVEVEVILVLPYELAEEVGWEVDDSFEM